MKKKFVIALSIIMATVVLLTSCEFFNSQNKKQEEVKEETYDQAVTVDISTDLASATDISPYIYGQFIEHIPGCIYNGIWAEVIMDRKFYLPFGDMVSYWTVNDSTKAITTTARTLSGSYAANLKTGGKISQKIELDTKGYEGYINAFAAESTAEVVVALKNKGSTQTKTITVTSTDYAKYEFAFEGVADRSATISFECTSGEVTLDSLSLMPDDNIDGMRKDTLDILKDMGGTIYRWPGGNFVSGYDWEDGIGNRDTRPNKRNLHYAGLASSFSSEQAMMQSDRTKILNYGIYSVIEPNDMGTDEFITMCRYIGAEPYIVVNTGLGESTAAAKWVEYCNGSVSTVYGAKRARNGNATPYNVVYWGIGNEMNGRHQLGYMSSQSQYILKHDQFITAMKNVDSTIKVFAVGDNYSDYTKNMMQQGVNDFDYIQEHFYAERNESNLSTHVKNMYDGLLLRLNKHRDLITRGINDNNTLFSLDEYAYNNVFCASRLKDAFGIGVALNLLIDNCDIVGMACYSSTVNATQGCVTTTNTGVMYQGSGLVLKAYRKYMQSQKTTCTVRGVESDVYCSATISEDGKQISLAVVNATNKGLLLQGSVPTGAKKITRASVVGTDVEVYNSESNPDNLTLNVTTISRPIVPAYSVSILVFDME